MLSILLSRLNRFSAGPGTEIDSRATEMHVALEKGAERKEIIN